ncbi:cytochrome C biogenesis protein transmembrane region [Salinisphaera dokdonensis CL-ES53]|uniref:Thiol:disulfide interchange protein DsbD n=1 Tax=Salinisphaera dokdonensis CL-ES53 TaxID=1304272 RepID=A0ABV2B0S6_9GAMM
MTSSPAAAGRAPAPYARAFFLCSLCVLTLLSAISAPARAADDFLPVEQAFAPSAARTVEGDIAVTWQVADTYYLYRHAFDFALVDAGPARIGEPQIPDGEKHEDEFFGPVETYRDSVTVRLPVEDGPELADEARIEVTYQGCADAGLCYPPQTIALDIADAPAGATATAETTTNTSTGTGDSASDSFLTQQDDLAGRLANADTLSTLGLFFVFGLLLAFTPCILPMIPILSGLIVGANAPPRRAFALSVAYVLAMALAYTVFGVIAGYFGANLQAALQMPAVLIPFAGVFALLALAAFGVFQLQVPGALQARLGGLGTRRGGLAGAGIMGFFSALIAGPCLAPPLVGALLYISSSGDMLLGGAALFMLGLGMGVPLIAIGVFGARIMPHAGAWMNEFRVASGVVLLMVALWLLSRILPADVTLAGWGLIALGYGSYLSTLATQTRAATAIKRALVFAVLVYAGAALTGVLIGGGTALRPLAGLGTAANGATSTADVESPFTRIDNLEQLQAALDTARANGRPAVVDFYADWCVECVEMEHGLFADPAVRDALSNVAALQVDVTDYDDVDRKLMRELDVFGPPTVLFYRANGEEAADQRLIGKIDTDGFIERLNRLDHAGNAP